MPRITCERVPGSVFADSVCGSCGSVCGCDIFKKFTILTLSGKINNNDIHPVADLEI